MKCDMMWPISQCLIIIVHSYIRFHKLNLFSFHSLFCKRIFMSPLFLEDHNIKGVFPATEKFKSAVHARF